ncbi:MAG TPA: hypothetical protein VF970_01400 [Gemmatimonadales bacterium]
MGFLRKLFGKTIDLESLPAELRALLEEMRKERNAFEAVAIRTTSAVKGAEALAAPVANAEKQLAEVTRQLAKLDGIPAQVEAVDVQVAAVTAGQQDAQRRLNDTQLLAEQTRAEVSEVRRLFEDVLALKQTLAGVLELGERFKGLEAEYGEAALRFKEVQRVADDSDKRLAQFEEQWSRMSTAVETLAAQLEKYEETAADLRQLTSEMPNTKRELGTLKSLADFVTQHMSTLEGQKDAVDRATKGAERLADLMAQVDRQLQQQHANTKFLAKVEEDVSSLRQLHGTLLGQAGEIQQRYQAIEAQERTHRDQFARLQTEVQDAASHVALERDGLTAIDQRVVLLRDALGGLEQRLPMLDEARTAIQGVEQGAGRLAARVAALVDQLGNVEADAAALRGVQEAVQRVEVEGNRAAAMVEVLEERTARFEEARSRIEGLEAKLAGLAAAEEKVEQALALARERQAAVDAVRADLRRLFEVADATMDNVRNAASLQQDVEQRRQALDEVMVKLRELDRQAEGLEQRRRQFEETEQRVAHLDALVITIQSTLQTVLDQKDFLDKVVETTGTLTFQTMQAEAVIATLRQEREAAQPKKA